MTCSGRGQTRVPENVKNYNLHALDVWIKNPNIYATKQYLMKNADICLDYPLHCITPNYLPGHNVVLFVS